MKLSPIEAERVFLRFLSSGCDYGHAVRMFGESGVRVAFRCTEQGWVSQGRLTDAGRALAGRPVKTTKFEITTISRVTTMGRAD